MRYCFTPSLHCESQVSIVEIRDKEVMALLQAHAETAESGQKVPLCVASEHVCDIIADVQRITCVFQSKIGCTDSVGYVC